MARTSIPVIDEERKSSCLRRLQSIEGQVRGIGAMIEQGRPCAEILGQIAAAREGLTQVGRIMMRNYLERCATDAIRSQDKKAREKTYDELMDLILKFSR